MPIKTMCLKHGADSIRFHNALRGGSRDKTDCRTAQETYQ